MIGFIGTSFSVSEKKHSTTDAIAQFIEDVFLAFDNSGYTVAYINWIYSILRSKQGIRHYRPQLTSEENGISWH